MTTPPGTPADPGGVPASPDVNLTTEQLDVGGTTRTYLLATPKTGTNLPLVLVLHGDGGDGPAMRKAMPVDTFSGKDAIVAYPTGTAGGWALYDLPAANQDMLFIEALVTAVKAAHSVDPKRVFGAAFSSGAYFLQQMACYKNGFFRGLASHSGGSPSFPDGDPNAGQWDGTEFAKCQGQLMGSDGGGLALLAVHGENDDPGGGEFSAQYWAFINGCGTDRAATTPAPCEAYSGCPNDKPVWFCGIDGLDHNIWSNAASVTWTFVSQLK